MPIPTLEEDYWICQMCGQMRQWHKRAFIVGQPSCFLICKSCWHDLGQQFHTARLNSFQKMIELSFFQYRREMLAHTISRLEETLKQEAKL